MPQIASIWQIIWDPAGANQTQVATGQLIADEIKMPGQAKVDERALPDAAFLDLLPRGLVSEQLTFTVYNDYTDHNAAMDGQLAWKAALPWGLNKPLRIVSGSGAKYQYGQAVLVGGEPVRLLTGPRVACTYQYRCSGFVLVP